jgi:hypothetical protein
MLNQCPLILYLMPHAFGFLLRNCKKMCVIFEFFIQIQIKICAKKHVNVITLKHVAIKHLLAHLAIAINFSNL